MALSILSLGMFAARAFWITRRRAGLVSGLGPPDFTAIARSFPMRVKAFAILSHRLNMVAFLVSKILPMGTFYQAAARRGSLRGRMRDDRRRSATHRVRSAGHARACRAWRRRP